MSQGYRNGCRLSIAFSGVQIGGRRALRDGLRAHAAIAPACAGPRQGGELRDLRHDGVKRGRTEHFRRWLHYMRYMVTHGFSYVFLVRTFEMYADCLTKVSGRHAYFAFRNVFFGYKPTLFLRRSNTNA